MGDYAGYTVVEDTPGCASCGANKTWSVLRPDGMALATSFLDKDDADELADELNAAVQLNRERQAAPVE